MAEVAQRQRVRHERDMWDKIWRDKHGQVVVWQWPNVWLIAWAVILLISFIFPPKSSVATVLWWVSLAVLTVWAGLELLKGVNYFRRALGAVVLLLVLLMAFRLA